MFAPFFQTLSKKANKTFSQTAELSKTWSTRTMLKESTPLYKHRFGELQAKRFLGLNSDSKNSKQIFNDFLSMYLGQ